MDALIKVKVYMRLPVQCIQLKNQWLYRSKRKRNQNDGFPIFAWDNWIASRWNELILAILVKNNFFYLFSWFSHILGGSYQRLNNSLYLTFNHQDGILKFELLS